MTSKDLVTIEGTMKATDVLSYFENPAEFTFTFEEDPEAVSARIQKEIMTASLDELLGERVVLKGQEHLNEPFEFRGVQWRPSDEEGHPFYALFTVADANGEVHLMSCGATTVMLKAARISQLGGFPLWLKLVPIEVKNKVKGRKPPLDLVKAPNMTPDTSTEGEAF